MRLYETTFILSPQADDAAFDRQIKAVNDVISRYQGKVIREIRWGIRRMAYPIKRFNQGFYTRIIFEADRKVLLELERFYKIEEPYIRYLTVVYEGNLDNEPEREIASAYEPAAVPKPQAESTEPRESAATETPSPAQPESKTSWDRPDHFEEKYGDQDI